MIFFACCGFRIISGTNRSGERCFEMGPRPVDVFAFHSSDNVLRYDRVMLYSRMLVEVYILQVICAFELRLNPTIHYEMVHGMD